MTEAEVIEILKHEMNHLETLYKSAVINYAGRADITNRYYSEVSSEYLLLELNKNPNLFDVIHPKRVRHYFHHSHLNGKVRIAIGNYDEENTVKRMVLGNRNLGELGEPIDFQVPLNQRRIDKRGKIDLLTFNRDTNCFYIVETKAIDSHEQALRAILEVETYKRMTNDQMFINEYPEQLRRYYNIEISNQFIFKEAILLFKKSDTANQIKANDSRGRALRALAHKLAIQVFILPPPEEPIRLNLEDKIL